MIHELGHLLTAKMFKVYCFEYSIGFGPKLFSFRRKNGETYFSLRAIPFGGFVSMYGEGDTVPEGVNVDPSRSLLAIKKWKRAIIMVAGVTMNFLLAIVIFLVYEGCFPRYQARYAHVSIDKDSIAESIGLNDNAFVYAQTYYDDNHSLVFYDDNAVITYENDLVKTVYFGLDYSSLSLNDTSLVNHAVIYDKKVMGALPETPYEEISVSDAISGIYDENTNYKLTGFVCGYVTDDANNKLHLVVTQNFAEDDSNDKAMAITFDLVRIEKKFLQAIPNNSEVTVIGKIHKNTNNGYQYLDVLDNDYLFEYPDIDAGNWMGKKRNNNLPLKLSFTNYVVDEANPSGRGSKEIKFLDLAFTEKDGSYVLPEKLGMHLRIDAHRNTFGQAFVGAFKDFANAGSLIYRSLGMLFTDKNAWQNVGGIIAIGVVTTQILKQNGFGLFLYYWAIISVNLGIVNLLPFPGLDGWQFLVIIVEGIFKKEIPQKVKNWFSIVGLVLLFAIMILVVIKDLITYI